MQVSKNHALKELAKIGKMDKNEVNKIKQEIECKKQQRTNPYNY